MKYYVVVIIVYPNVPYVSLPCSVLCEDDLRIGVLIRGLPMLPAKLYILSKENVGKITLPSILYVLRLLAYKTAFL